MFRRRLIIPAGGLGAVGLAAALFLGGSAGASYPNPTTGPDGSLIPANLAHQAITLDVNDHGVWKILTIHPSEKVVNGKDTLTVTQAEFDAAKANAQVDPNPHPQGPPAGAYHPPGAP